MDGYIDNGADWGMTNVEKAREIKLWKDPPQKDSICGVSSTQGIYMYSLPPPFSSLLLLDAWGKGPELEALGEKE